MPSRPRADEFSDSCDDEDALSSMSRELLDAALFHAVVGENTERAKLLLIYGADAKRANRNGRTPLMVAASLSDADMVALLIPGSDSLAKDRHGMTALMEAASALSLDCLTQLLPISDARARNENNETALSFAVSAQGFRCVEALLPHSDANVRNADKMTPLMLAVELDDANLATLLLPASDASALSAQGETLFGLAIREQAVSVMNALRGLASDEEAVKGFAVAQSLGQEAAAPALRARAEAIEIARSAHEGRAARSAAMADCEGARLAELRRPPRSL